MAASSRYRTAVGVGDKATISAAECDYYGIMTDHIDIVHRHHSLVCTMLRKSANAAEVRGITQSDTAHTKFLRSVDANIHGLGAHHALCERPARE